VHRLSCRAQERSALVKRGEGHIIFPPMPFPWFKTTRPKDRDAVIAFVRAIAPAKNKVERTAFQKHAFP